MGMFSRLKAYLNKATAAPLAIPDSPFPAIGVSDLSEFRHGLELQNDEQTPIEFVVQELRTHAGLSAGDAAVAAALCHSQGGVVVSLAGNEQAAAAARAVASSAAAAGYPLRCRAILHVGASVGGPPSASLHAERGDA